MLVLTRNVGQKVYVDDRQGNRMVITVLTYKDGRIKLGFEDKDHNFLIERPNRFVNKEATPPGKP